MWDSARIVERLEELVPQPALYPTAASHRAGAEIFLEWFNDVWKGPPNAIQAELRKPSPDAARVEALSARLAGWLPTFEALLAETDYRLGDEFTVADLMAFPFLRFGTGKDPADEEPLHRILVERMPLGSGYPRLRAWIERCDAHPRA